MKRHFLVVIAVVATVSAFPSHAASESKANCAPRESGDSAWDGIGIMRGGKGYAETPMGQVHYRFVQPEKAASGPVILLLHQTPWSSIQFADIQSCLAVRGIRSIAIDTPGYGMSDRPVGTPAIAEYADNIIPVLDYLNISDVVVAGHHTGAAIAASFARRHADRVKGVILHGAPNYNDEERAQRRALPHADLTLQPDGSHLSGYFSRLYKSQGTQPRHLATITWSTLNIFLAGKSDVAHAAVYDNDMEADLQAIDVRVLILSDGGDALNPIDRRTASMKRNFQYQHFSDGSPHAMMVEPSRWAQVAAEFIRSLSRAKS